MSQLIYLSLHINQNGLLSNLSEAEHSSNSKKHLGAGESSVPSEAERGPELQMEAMHAD